MPIPTLSNGAPSLQQSTAVTRLSLGAWLLVLALLLQFLFAGLASFQDATKWVCHIGLGFAIGFLIFGMALAAFLSRAGAGLRGWLVSLAVSYVIQIGLIRIADAEGLPLARALHPFNGSILLTLALVIAMKLSWPSIMPRRR